MCAWRKRAREYKMMKIESAPPFIDTRRGGVHVREGKKSPFLPESRAYSEQLL